jgi:hypothetical protein
MARHRCGLRYMAKWSEDHVAAIGSLHSTPWFSKWNLVNWRPGGALRWKVETAGWEGPGVVCGKPAPQWL